ncbi:S26 family signal peptidase [Mycobacterium sp. B14F4]|uniref:S26 family signal peptidase n=1 Tax=Mycobacterium sp. B14F4 TaxID=3153565 RepID=UPI00325CA537
MRFKVVDESMRPTLVPGDGLLALRGGSPRRGQLRVFPDPRRSSRWLVKRIGEVHGSGRSAIFEARSDNPGAAGAADSHEFGWVPAAGSYRVVWTVKGEIAR